MDQRTLAAYEAEAGWIAQQYRSISTPMGLQQQMLAFFHAGESVADIGCGSGRDTAWLAEHDFSVVGYDGSPAMLAEARKYYPHLRFEQALLPDLRGIADESFANLLCAATLMHIEAVSSHRDFQQIEGVHRTWLACLQDYSVVGL